MPQYRHRRLVAFLTVALLVLLPPASLPTSATAAIVPIPPPTVVSTTARATDQLIVTLKPNTTAGLQVASQPNLVAAALSAAVGTELTYLRPFDAESHVLRLTSRRAYAEVEALAQQLTASPDVLYAEPDAILQPTLEPTDPSYSRTWHLWGVTPTNYGANLPAAWNITTGSASIVTAIIDTGGRLTHEDLAGRTPTGNPGYDMITDVAIANDGNGRDADPSDPGDYVTPAEATADCGSSNSSWHGSHVGGTIGARANNGKGIAGINWVSPLLFVRVLSKCGGYSSDIIDGMRWAAGLSVTGVPSNPNPARVMNLSLGGSGPCSTAVQTAVNAVTATGAVVVVAAGNENDDAANAQPASCANVITVAATAKDGNRAYYSNYGSLVELAGPGGDSTVDSGVYSTVDRGTYGPAGDAYASYQGTSMATPHVAGIVSLMLSANPALTSAQVLQILQKTVTPFPASSTCRGICGAGIVNAGAAVEEATRILIPYSVSGRVSNSANAALAEVTVTDGAGHSATTAADGTYTLNRLAAGSYTLTPTKRGYSFAPASRSISLSGNLTGQAFMATLNPYESNDTCAQAGAITPDGSVQHHTFATPGDIDWTTFSATAGSLYRIEVQIPATSPADVAIELYSQCGDVSTIRQDYAFAPGARIEITAPATGPIFLKLLNHDPVIAGSTVSYDLSVRVPQTQATGGALILVAGRLKNDDQVQANIHHVTNAVYAHFTAHGYTKDRINYLATDLQIPGVNGLASSDNLRDAITRWALDKVGPNQALTIYLMDHGSRSYGFYLDAPRGERLMPTQLAGWIAALEAARPGVQVNIIIEACYSEAFVPALSKVGRVVITSTGSKQSAYASPQGAFFSDQFLSALGGENSLYLAFQQAREAVFAAHYDQAPALDDNGNGQANDGGDGTEAQRRGFAFTGTLGNPEDDASWPPYIRAVQIDSVATGQGAILAGTGQWRIRAQVQDNKGVGSVWAVIYAPDYQPPLPSEGLLKETLPTVMLLDQGNGWYAATSSAFTASGTYRVVVFADDGAGQPARPVAVELPTRFLAFVPLLRR